MSAYFRFIAILASKRHMFVVDTISEIILLYICPHTTVSSPYQHFVVHTSSDMLTTIYVSSYYYICVLRNAYYYICVLVLPFHRITRIEKVHVRSRHDLRNAKDLLQTLQRHLLLLVRNAGGRADRQHTSAYVSIRPHAAYVSIRQHTPAYLAAARIFWSSTVSSMCTRVAVLYTCESRILGL